MATEEKQRYLIHITSKPRWYDLKLREIGQYRDLIFLFVRRNFTTRYKQTVLGPAWLILAPLINTVISTFVFGTIAKIPSDGVPYFLFYLCGSTAWSYFAGCLNNTSATFTGNAGIFGKVYFPRLVTPISNVITGFFDFLIQFGMFAAFWVYFRIGGVQIAVTWAAALIPLLMLQMAALGLGCGIIISSLTTKYRDLSVLVGFGVQLWMYVTPLIYSESSLSAGLRAVSMLNPMAPVLEIFRFALLGTGEIAFGYWGLSLGVTAVVLFLGVILFNRVEKTFMDTV